jgi:carbamate kinase
LIVAQAALPEPARRERIVAVLGGNAFVAPGEPLTMDGQLRFASQAMEQLAPLLDQHAQLLLSHGNGPQVGHMLTRVEAAAGRAYRQPLEVCVAESQGELGYVLQQALQNALARRGRSRPCVALLSQVEVAEEDPAFAVPTKPIGGFFRADQARALRAQGFAMAEDAGRGWRRVVPSPAPRHVLELEVIRHLLEQNVVVIAAGGGGIPVVRRDDGWAGVEAVIDKDQTGALLATKLDADRFVILTDVPCVYRDFRSPSRQPLAALTVAEARRLAAAGEFPAGSMLPKIEAAIHFAATTGRPALICNPGNLAEALRGNAGTLIAPAPFAAASADQPTTRSPELRNHSSQNQPLQNQPPQNRSSQNQLAVVAAPGAQRSPLRTLILGAAGRDFHNFQTFFRDRSDYVVCGFTAAQIPYIAEREFPASLSGPRYGQPIPIYSEQRLPELIRELDIDCVFLAYSDLSHIEVMRKASIVLACGASFGLLGPRHTQLAPRVPVVSVTAVRTGAGKSPLSQFLAQRIAAAGHRLAVLRHPMPYGDLAKQRVERFQTWEDLDRFECTVEEREEYEPYVQRGLAVFAGVDYAAIVAAAEAEADAILWDGGNNDFPFVRPALSIVVADALRAGHESLYHPGEANARMADVLVINKAGQVAADRLAALRSNLRSLNPRAEIVMADLAVELAADDSERIRGRRVLVVEDGPTLTHGGMSFGAGTLAARRAGAAELIDPRAAAVGSIAEAYREFPHLGPVLPALGYSEQQRVELAETIDRCGAEVVVDASPCRLERLITMSRPVVRVGYRFEQLDGPDLLATVLQALCFAPATAQEPSP